MKKLCTKCSTVKPIIEFYKRHNSSNLYRSHCKKCCNTVSFSGITEVSEKICTTCSELKSIIHFAKKKTSKDGYNAQCRKCVNIKRKSYTDKNRTKIREQQKQWKRDNKKWLDDWYKTNIDIIRVNRMKNQRIRLLDPLENLKSRIRKSILQTFYSRGFTKKSKTVDILGCSFDEFKIYLEERFESWMDWDNRGLYNGEFDYGWDIDHIIPLDTAITEKDILKLNHHTNLQPLCSKINRDIKRNH